MKQYIINKQHTPFVPSSRVIAGKWQKYKSTSLHTRFAPLSHERGLNKPGIIKIRGVSKKKEELYRFPAFIYAITLFKRGRIAW
jgi:hypothetical protein